MTTTQQTIKDDIDLKYIEWIEDLGISQVDILVTLLEKERSKNEDLRRRLSNYENR